MTPPTLLPLGHQQGSRTSIEFGFIKGLWTWESLRETYDKLRNRKGPLPPKVALEQCFCVDARKVALLERFYFRGVDPKGQPLAEDRKVFYAYMESLLKEVENSDEMLQRWDYANVKMQSADPWRHTAITFPKFLDPLKTERDKQVIQKCVVQALIRGQGMIVAEAGREAEQTLETLHSLMEAGDVEQAINVLKIHTAEAYSRALTERD